MSTIWVILLFLLGFVLISKGGDFFLDAAIWIAEAYRIPKLIVGAVIVTIGTTLPEMIVSVSAALEGSVDLATSNAIGSMTANLGLIVSLTIILMPSVIKRKRYLKKITLAFVSILSLMLFSWDGALRIWESLVMIAFSGLFIAINIHDTRQSNLMDSTESDRTPASDDPSDSNEETIETLAGFDWRVIGLNVGKFMFGAAGIIVGAQLLIDNGIELGQLLGIPEVVIGFTAVAIGTSLPELTTAIKSIRRGEVSMTIGNVIGANVVATTLILPVSSLLTGGALEMPVAVVRQDMPLYVLILVIIFLPALIRQRFARSQGILTSLVYMIYLVGIFMI